MIKCLSHLFSLLILSIFLLVTIPVSANANTTSFVLPTDNYDDVCNLPAPASLQITGTTSSSVTASWSAVPGASAYQVKATDINNGTIYFNAPVGGLSQTINAPAGATMLISVQSICANGEISDEGIYIKGQVDYIIIEDVVSTFEPTPNQPLNPCNGYSSGTELKLVAQKVGTSDKTPFKVNFIIADAGDSMEVYVAHDNLNSLINAGGAMAWFITDSEGNIAMGNDEETDQNTFHIHHEVVIDGQVDAQVLTVTVLPGDDGNAEMCWTANNPLYSIWTALPGGDDDKALSRPKSSTAIGATLTPNPFGKTLELRLEKPSFGNTSIHLYDLNGRELLFRNVEEGESRLILEAGHLQSGVYMARIESPEGIQTIKVVKQ